MSLCLYVEKNRNKKTSLCVFLSKKYKTKYVFVSFCLKKSTKNKSLCL